MDPTHNTSPNESALPNVPPQVPGGGFGTPAVWQGQMAGPDVVPGPNGGAPLTPPPAAGGWLPPTVAVQSTGQTAGNTGGAQQSSQSSGLNVSAPQIADDGDVIEKEWVDGAKQIVAHTRQDPYRQTKELHKFKAEYMQKRYNKTIEAVDE